MNPQPDEIVKEVPSSTQRQIAMVKGPHHFFLRYEAGEEETARQAMNEWVKQGLIDWFDSAAIVWRMVQLEVAAKAVLGQ